MGVTEAGENGLDFGVTSLKSMPEGLNRLLKNVV